jgi:Ni/Co efflux regulator RcnB
MKPPIFATLALCLLGVPAQAQLQLPNPAVTAPQVTTEGNLAGPRVASTSPGDLHNPVPHIYHRGEHLSAAYGGFELVPNWSRFGLSPPPQGYHWVEYGRNYLLVESNTGLIADIVAQI